MEAIPIFFLKSLSRLASAVVILVGCLVFVGWALDILALESIFPGLATMKPNTALAFILAGAALWILQDEQGDYRRRHTAQLCALIVAAIGLLTLSEYLFGWDWGIDQFLFKNALRAGGSSPAGRMSPATALSFLALGLALYFLGIPRGHLLSQFFALIAFILALLALTGYAYGVTSLYKVSPYSSVALHTALAFFVSSMGTLWARPNRGVMAVLTQDSSGSAMARRLLPAAILVPFTLGWLRLGGERAGLYGTAFGLALFALSNMFVFAILTGWNVGLLNRTDVERKRAEVALRESETLFRRLFANNPLPMWVYDRETLAFLDVNETAVVHYGYSREEFLQMRITDIRPSEDIPRLIDNLAQQRPKVQFSGEWRHRRKDGQIIEVEIVSHTLVFQERQAALVVAQDITERKRVEEERAQLLTRERAARTEAEAAQRRVSFLSDASALLASSLDYKTTLDHLAKLAVPDMADWCTVDVLGKSGDLDRLSIAHIDPEKAELARELQRRYPPDPNAPYGVYHVIRTGQPELYPEIPDSMIEAAARDEEYLKIVRELRLRSAMVVPLSARGQVLGVITFVSTQEDRRYGPDDLTMSEELAQRAALSIDNALLYQEAQTLNAELEQRVHERTAQLEAANKELEAFSYSVSHDLRAPLRAIDGFSRILLEKYTSTLDDQARRYLQRVRDGTQRMGRLIDDLLTFSRLSRQPLNKQSVALDALIRQTLQELSDEQQNRQVEIAVGDLPVCEGDPALLKQVFFNLLANALKFTRQCDIAQIEVGCHFSDGVPIYYVKDNGVGFDMRYADQLFGVFQRLHRAEDYEGTGVGLATVQRIIYRHGGRIWAEASVNEGAAFYFTLEAEET